MTDFSKVSVIGCGRWGGFLGWYCATYKKSDVLFLGVPGDPAYESLIKTGFNGYCQMPENVSYTTDMADVMKNDFIIISIGCQGFRDLCKQMSSYNLKGKKFLLAMKGLESTTGKRMTQIFAEEISEQDVQVAVLGGPGHPQDYLKGIPSCVVISSASDEAKYEIADYMNSNLIRSYYGTDLIGNEVAAALKNVVGVMAGILDGMGWTSLKGSLMARGPVEVGRIIEYFGGQSKTAYGLAHLGDYEATLFSPHSHNRAYGEAWAKGEKFEKLAEGVPTLKAIYALRDKLEIPLCTALYHVIYENADPKKEIETLFQRPVKSE